MNLINTQINTGGASNIKYYTVTYTFDASPINGDVSTKLFNQIKTLIQTRCVIEDDIAIRTYENDGTFPLSGVIGGDTNIAITQYLFSTLSHNDGWYVYDENNEIIPETNLNEFLKKSLFPRSFVRLESGKFAISKRDTFNNGTLVKYLNPESSSFEDIKNSNVMFTTSVPKNEDGYEKSFCIVTQNSSLKFFFKKDSVWHNVSSQVATDSSKTFSLQISGMKFKKYENDECGAMFDVSMSTADTYMLRAEIHDTHVVFYTENGEVAPLANIWVVDDFTWFNDGKGNENPSTTLIYDDPKNPNSSALIGFSVSGFAGGGDGVLKTGDTMTGHLTLVGAPVAPLHAATKKYVDDAVASGGTANALPLIGGTMTGHIVLKGDPVLPLHPATKKYTDDVSALRLPLAGGTMSGPVTLSGVPVDDYHAANKKYVLDEISSAKTVILKNGTEVFAKQNTDPDIQLLRIGAVEDTKKLSAQLNALVGEFRIDASAIKNLPSTSGLIYKGTVSAATNMTTFTDAQKGFYWVVSETIASLGGRINIQANDKIECLVDVVGTPADLSSPSFAVIPSFSPKATYTSYSIVKVKENEGLTIIDGEVSLLKSKQFTINGTSKELEANLGKSLKSDSTTGELNVKGSAEFFSIDTLKGLVLNVGNSLKVDANKVEVKADDYFVIDSLKGLQLSTNASMAVVGTKLTVKHDEYFITDAVKGLQLSTDSTIVMDTISKKLGVKASEGFKIDPVNGLSFKLPVANSLLRFNGNSELIVNIDTDEFSADEFGLHLKVKENTGLKQDASGLSVNFDPETLKIDPTSLKLKVRIDKGLEVNPAGDIQTKNGLFIKHDNDGKVTLNTDIMFKEGTGADAGKLTLNQDEISVMLFKDVSLLNKGIYHGNVPATLAGLAGAKKGDWWKANAPVTLAGQVFGIGDELYCVTEVHSGAPTDLSSFVVVPNTNETMVGATTTVAGISGNVPAPDAGSADRVLKADGTWGEVVYVDTVTSTKYRLIVENGVPYLESVNP